MGLRNPFVLVNCDHGAMIVNQLDYNFYPDGGIYGVGAQIIGNGACDPQEIELIKKLLTGRRRLGRNVFMVDVGANIGTHTVECAKHMRGWGSVLAIEPQERIFYALCGNIALHNCFNARAMRAVVGSLPDKSETFIPTLDYSRPSSFGSLSLQMVDAEPIGQPVDYNHPTDRVGYTNIDKLDIARVDFIKIDVEGMEFDVLEGARNTIARDKPTMLIEHFKIDRAQLSTLFTELGYEGRPVGINTIARAT